MVDDDPFDFPCDGRLPDDYQAPELKDRLTRRNDCHCVDLTRLEPPAPLVLTLKVLSSLAAHEKLQATYPHYPVHLIPMLAEEGWRAAVISDAPGQVVLEFTRRTDET